MVHLVESGKVSICNICNADDETKAMNALT